MIHIFQLILKSLDPNIDSLLRSMITLTRLVSLIARLGSEDGAAAVSIAASGE